MTQDKIRFYIGEYLYKYWNSQTDRSKIENARNILKSEIESGLSTSIKHRAELNLLNHLLN